MIRRAKTKDLEALIGLFIAENKYNASLAPEIVRHTDDVLSSLELQEILSDEAQLFIVSERDGKVVAALLGKLVNKRARRWTQSRTYGYVEEIIVAQKARKLGIATQLMNDFTQWAVALGADSVDLHVWSNNTSAIGFYDSVGFQTKQQLLSKKLSK